MEACGVQNVAVAAPRTVVLNVCSNLKGGRRTVFNMWLSPRRCAHSSQGLQQLQARIGTGFAV
eukprot:2344022-Pyramimonas_sp.AAC.1